MWKPLERLKQKLTGAPVAESPAPPKAPQAAMPPATASGKPGGLPDIKELEKKGLMSQFFRHWKNPAFLKQVQAVAARMQAEGVNIKDQGAVKAWMEAHQKELMSGSLGAATASQPKPLTFVKTGPELGRNDPCHCGSGKKFKKCHGAGA